MLSRLVSRFRIAIWRHYSSLVLGEDRLEILPFFEIGRRQIIRLAFDDRAQGALLIDTQIRCCRRTHWHRWRFQRAVALQLNVENGLGVLALQSAIRLLPT